MTPARTCRRRSKRGISLQRLLPKLAEEFEHVHTPEEIRACADAILSRYVEAPIRTHVITLAHRKARECLRKESCDVLAVA